MLASLLEPHSAADAIDGAWTGAISLDGSDWPVRFDISSDEAAISATMDLPTLGMIAESIDIRRANGDAVVIDIPFGLGEYELAPDGETLTTRSLAGNSITLNLHRPADAARDYTTAEITFECTDGLTLHGTLYRPRAPGPHAAIVLLHGAEPKGRDHWGYRSWAHHYASNGLAALVYDKRSSETSADLAVLSRDAQSAHAWLRAQDGIRAEAVGFAGGSQAPWLGASVAADPDAQVAFMIMSGWPACTPREQDLQALRHGMLDDGIAPEDVEAAVAYTNLMFYVARTGRLWSEFEPIVAEAAASEPWGQYVNQPQSLDDLSWWNRNMDFGGEKDLALVSCPVLALYGDADWVVPPSENADRLVRTLTRAGNEDVQVAVFPEADHRGEVGFSKVDGKVRWPQLAPGLFDTIDTWLAEHGFTSGR